MPMSRFIARTTLASSLLLLMSACTQEPAQTAGGEPMAESPASVPTDTPVPGEMPMPGQDPAVVDQAAADASAATLATDCDADAVRALIGQEATDAVVDQATRDSHSRSVRVLKPGDAATMDFRADRLNIDVDDGGVIRSLRCG